VADRGGCREDPGSCKEAILAVTVSKSEKAKPKEIKVKGQKSIRLEVSSASCECLNNALDTGNRTACEP
jgi:hypothetical protein